MNGVASPRVPGGPGVSPDVADRVVRDAVWGYEEPIPEAAVVASYGGQVVFLPLVEGLSTSEAIRRIRQGEQQAGER